MPSTSSAKAATQSNSVSQAPLTYSTHEEKLNAITHGVGLIVAIIGLVFLLLKADSGLAITSVAIYGSTLIMMFAASTVYHSVDDPGWKQTLKLFDHSAIYLLIAGTYTPLLLLSFDGALSLFSMLFIWLLAAIGIGFKLITRTRFPKVAVATYLTMGWFAVALIYPLVKYVPHDGLWLLLAGGLFFTIGVIFYVAKHKNYTHAIWHLFVLGGCSCHYLTVYLYVI